MFYSQIVLSKKGPLGKVWLAAHHEKKLSRPQVFAFDISDSVKNIVHPVVPLALRVSGHLLLGVVRIYSRKVNYLVEDAHEASIKINTAFTAQPALDIATKPRQADHLNVANFGEFHPIAFVEGGFDIPTDLVGEDWDVADDDGGDEGDVDDSRGEDGDEEDEPARKRRRSNLPPDDSVEQATFATGGSSPHRGRASHGAEASLRSDLTTSGLNEDWPAFNPDDEDEDDGEGSKHSSLPEIEVTRAADNTFASDSQVRGASTLGDDSLSSFPKPPHSPAARSVDFPQPNDGMEEEALLPFDDDEEAEDVHGTQPPAEPRASLALSLSHEASAIDDNKTTLSVSGLEDSHDKSGVVAGVGGLSTGSLEKDKDDRSLSSGEFPQIAASSPAPSASSKKRSSGAIRRKRRIRKIAMDAGDTRLSADEIREHLNDPSDLEVRQIHPSTWLPGVPAAKQPTIYQTPAVEELLEQSMPIERYLARPCLADDGSLCPKLLNLWLRNTAPVLGKPFAYELQPQRPSADGKQEEDGVELTRRAQDEGGEFERQPSEPKLTEEEEPEFSQPGDDEEDSPPNEDAPMPFDDDEGVPPPMDDESAPMEEETVGDDDAMLARARVSGLSLGLVNDFGRDLEDESEDDPRQDQGDTLASSSTKWHKHTVKVYDMIHRSMPAADSGRPRQLFFDTICNSVTRRTACGVFFELLQLKTWDIIELDQDEFFGDMKISPGLRFDEVPPTSS